jgi:hypothetical protein
MALLSPVKLYIIVFTAQSTSLLRISLRGTAAEGQHRFAYCPSVPADRIGSLDVLRETA